MLSLGNIDLSAFKFYTGLKDRQLFELLYKELELNASRLKYWISTDKGQQRQTKGLGIEGSAIHGSIQVKDGNMWQGNCKELWSVGIHHKSYVLHMD